MHFKNISTFNLWDFLIIYSKIIRSQQSWIFFYMVIKKWFKWFATVDFNYFSIPTPWFPIPFFKGDHDTHLLFLLHLPWSFFSDVPIIKLIHMNIIHWRVLFTAFHGHSTTFDFSKKLLLQTWLWELFCSILLVIS